MKAKVLLVLMSILAVFCLTGSAFAVKPEKDVADDDGTGTMEGRPVSACGTTTDFLGLTPWYAGGSTGCLLDDENWTEDKLSVTIWTIVLNLVGDVVGVLGYVAIGLVIWGGYQYMLSQGDAGKAAKGKLTITHAVIGLVITILASTITKTIAGILSEAGGKNIFVNVFNHAFTWAAVVAVIMIVLGGIFYVTSTGDSGKVAKAKNTIIYAAIGLVISLAAIAIINTVIGAIGG